MTGWRPLRTDMPREFLPKVQNGIRRTKYRGVGFRKSPFDLVIYLQLMSKQVPATIIEIGSAYGGSALWFADMLCAHGRADGRVISIDLNLPKAVEDSRIQFLQGDAKHLEQVMTAQMLDSPRPWLVVEDSSHMFAESYAVLNFFHRHLKPDDYIVVEDGVVEFLPDERYAKYKSGPNKAVEAFLSEHGLQYEIDLSLCDHFGENVTYNPNAWLKRVQP